MPASLAWLRMTPRPRGYLLATTLLSLPYRSCAYLPWPPPQCLLPGLRPSSHVFSAAVRLQRASRYTASGRQFSSSTALLAERRKMFGPSPRPVEVKPMVDADGNKLSKPTKRKVAIVVGYVGTAFHGWQESTDRSVRTVEGVLEAALWKAGAIADSNYGDLNKICWGRTSRTDKGVHASKTVASAKLLLPQETFNEAGLSQFGKEILNKQLPSDVRCFSVSKVPKSFRGREECTLREYSYYLPKHLLPDEATVVKFRRLLNTFVGSHSFHNFASMRGRQLKEIRKRVQASIDLKKAAAGSGGGGTAGEEAASRDYPSGGNAGVSEAVDGDGENVVSHDDGKKTKPMSKRERSKDWRTYRYKKKTAVQQEEEDTWYGKAKPTPSEPSSSRADGAGAGEDAAEAEAEDDSTGRDADDTVRRNAAKSVPVGLAPVDGEPAPGDARVGNDGDRTEKDAVESVPIRGSAGGTLAIGEDDHVDGEDEEEAENEGEGDGAGDEGPQRVLMLRELRTSIYRCEVLEGVVRHTREGEAEADEFLRIDISGKAFVYNQIRLMIGGALGEARGELMPGFVDAALKTPYKLRVPLAPADGLVLESQAFTRHANALVLDPRDLSSLGGTLVKWGHVEGGNKMQTSGRLQTLMTLEQREEAEKWRDEHILPSVADAWAQRGSAELFLEAVQKFFVGQQQGKELQEAVKEHLEKLAETERAAEEKHNRHRLEAKQQGSTKYKDLLPKNIATRIICQFRLLPGNKVSAIQRGVAMRMDEGELPLLADCEQVLKFIEEKGVEEMAKEGGFFPPEIP